MEGEKRLSSAARDLIIICIAALAVLILSYFFDAFAFLTEFFRKYPRSIAWIDEIITFLVTLSAGFGIFSWRRWKESKREAAERIRLQEELLKAAEVREQAEKIVSNQLRCEIELRKCEEDKR